MVWLIITPKDAVQSWTILAFHHPMGVPVVTLSEDTSSMFTRPDFSVVDAPSGKD